MDGEAITELERIIQQSEVNARLSSESVDAVAVPEGTHLRDLEPFLPMRRAFRGAFKTSFISHFVRYIRTTLAEKPVDGALAVFVNATNMSAKTYFDRGSIEHPGHCNHNAELALVRAPAYTALLSIAKDYVTQRAFAEFFEDWKIHIVSRDANDGVIDFKDALRGIRAATVEKKGSEEKFVGNLSENRTLMESVDTHSKQGTIPSIIEFSCEPYSEMRSFTFYARVVVRTQPDLAFSLKLIAHEEIVEAMSDQFAETISDSFDKATVEVLVGTFTP